jgi:hypothetical protein
MNSRWNKYALALLAAVVCLPNLAISQDAGPSPEKMAEMMQKWMEASKPGKYHERMAKTIGKYTTETTVYGMGPAPMKSTGEAEIRWLLEGRWLITESKYSMMGQPMHGFAIQGYDNFKKKYVAIWVDSFSTALLTMSGNPSRDGKTEAMWGLMDEPMTGEVGKHVKYVTKVINDDKFIFEIHDLAIGGDKTRVVEIVYTRKPA